MDDSELIALRARVEKAVLEEMAKQLTASRVAAIEKETDTAIREIAREVIQSRKVEMRQRLESWFAANTEARIETIAKQMIDEALGEVRRRVLGRG